jgi:hypothetical protein
LVVLAAVAAALLALPVSASALEKGPEVHLSMIKVPVPDGYEVTVSAGRVGKHTPKVAVTIEQAPLTTNYLVREEPGAGLRATFGALGALDVRFERRRKMVERPEPGCRWIIETGVFRGSFDFAGEGGYLTVNAVNPVGEVFRLPDGFCGFGSFRLARPFIPGLYETVLEARMTDGSRTINFEASRFKGDRPVHFSASLHERVGSMTVERTAEAVGADEVFSHTKASRASVFPPPPFSGNARFSDPAAGPATWTGSLSTPFLGAPDAALTGEAFTAKLCPRLPVLTPCLRPRRRELYGSGSHSQPLALARLSSLR